MKLTDKDLKTIDRCMACGGSELASSETIEDPYRITYSRCRACNLMFMNPMPTQDWYDRFYAAQFWEGKATKGSDQQIRKQLAKEADRAHSILNFINGSVEGDGYLLELGCAFGLIARSLGERLDLTPVGVEPSDSARRFAEKHIKIVAKTAAGVADWKPDKPVRLIVLSNVLENIVDPESALRTLKDKLDGHLVIETPDPIFSKAVSIYHPYVYSAHALSALLIRTGFDVIRHQRDAADPQAQRFLATPGSGKSVLPDKPAPFFTVRRRAGQAKENYKKKYGKFLRINKRRRASDDWDERTIAALLDTS